MKTAVSIPDPLFKKAEKAAKKRGLTRSRLYQDALESYLKSGQEKEIAKAIDDYVARHGSMLSDEDEIWLAQGRKTVRRQSK